MKHFLIYHNEEGSFGTAKPENFIAFTGQKLNASVGDRIWIIVGKEEKKNSLREFILYKTFIIEHYYKYPLANAEFPYWFTGYEGKIFFPPIELNELDWFEKFKKTMAFFVKATEIKDEKYIKKLSHYLTEVI